MNDSKKTALNIFLAATKFKNEEIKSVRQIHNGFTNISFLFELKNRKKFQVRIGNDGGVVYRLSEKAILETIKNSNYIYYDLATGNAIKKWIKGSNPNWLICRLPFFLKSLAKEIKTLHSIAIGIEKTQNIKHHDYNCYLTTAKFPDDKHLHKYLELTKKYADLRLVLSHNDISPTNCLWQGKKVHLIDFEWGRINNEYWDLANFIRESGISMWHGKKLCKYYGNLDWNILKDFIYMCTNFALQWTFIMEQTPKIIKYRKKVTIRLEKYFKKLY